MAGDLVCFIRDFCKFVGLSAWAKEDKYERVLIKVSGKLD